MSGPVTMLQNFVIPAAILMTLGAFSSETGSVSPAAAQSSSPSALRMSPICLCSDRPKNRLHAAQIVAACSAVELDNKQPTSRRLEAMKRRLKISELVER